MTRSLLDSDLAAVPAEVPARLLEGRRVMTVCHRDPDGDALGSSLAIALMLESLGARVETVCADPVPPLYDFMPGIDRFQTAPSPDLEPDLIVVCDCGELARVGSVLTDHAELFARVPIVDIDHHISNPHFGTVDWVDADASATCEMVTLLQPHLDVPFDALDGAVATNLMTGLVIDTANFQHPNATPRTLRVAAELRAAGAPLSMIARRIYRTKPEAQLRLFGRVLAGLETSDDGTVAWGVLTPTDFRTSGATAQMSEGLIDLLAQSQVADVAILFKDQGAKTRISVRTRDGGIDATVLTGAFGGGGHARAAGATVERRLEDARTAVLAEAAKLIDEMARA